jgi:hypothetical protein
MDMHATDLVGINGITRVLLVYTCQQGVYPRGHVLPLKTPNAVCIVLNVLLFLCRRELQYPKALNWGKKII